MITSALNKTDSPTVFLTLEEKPSDQWLLWCCSYLASHLPSEEWLSWIKTLPAGEISFLQSQVSPRCISHLLNMPQGRSEENLSAAWHYKCWRLARYVSLASAQIQLLCRSAPPPTPPSAAAAVYCAPAKLAPFPTVLLSALEQSPSGTAGCHGSRSILPTGTVLERGESSCVTGDVGPWESSAQSFETKARRVLNLGNRVGLEGGRRKMMLAAFFPF